MKRLIAAAVMLVPAFLFIGCVSMPAKEIAMEAPAAVSVEVTPSSGVIVNSDNPAIRSAVKKKVDELLAFQKTLTVLALIRDRYYKEVDINKCADKILKGGVGECTDKFSFFMDGADTEQEQKEDDGEGYFGIGMSFSKKDGKVEVTGVMEGSPAERAGILAGDELVAVSSGGAVSGLLPVAELDDSKIVELIRGRDGTDVLLSLVRNGDPVSLTIKRANVIEHPVSIKMIEKGIGYVKIRNFIWPTAEEFVDEVSSLSVNGAEALIIDVRGNPGGLVESVVEIISYFKSDSEPIIYQQERDVPEYGWNPVEEDRGIFNDLKVVVLANKGSASSSEILTGWLKEDYGAVVVGEATYGKDLIQSVVPMIDGSTLRLTTAKYVIGSKRISIGGTGVIPTVEVKNSPDNKEDAQMIRAIEEARKLLAGSK